MHMQMRMPLKSVQVKLKIPLGVKRKDFRGNKAKGGLMEATKRLKAQGLKNGGRVARGCGAIIMKEKKSNKVFKCLDTKD